jgi:hypothetical protein
MTPLASLSENVERMQKLFNALSCLMMDVFFCVGALQ